MSIIAVVEKMLFLLLYIGPIFVEVVRSRTARTHHSSINKHLVQSIYLEHSIAALFGNKCSTYCFPS